jgi:hypothetical protein
MRGEAMKREDENKKNDGSAKPQDIHSLRMAFLAGAGQTRLEFFEAVTNERYLTRCEDERNSGAVDSAAQVS